MDQIVITNISTHENEKEISNRNQEMRVDDLEDELARLLFLQWAHARPMPSQPLAVDTILVTDWLLSHAWIVFVALLASLVYFSHASVWSPTTASWICKQVTISLVYWMDRVFTRGSKSNGPDVKRKTVSHTQRAPVTDANVRQKHSPITHLNCPRRKASSQETNSNIRWFPGSGKSGPSSNPDVSWPYLGFPTSNPVVTFGRNLPSLQSRTHPCRRYRGNSLGPKSHYTNVEMKAKHEDCLLHKSNPASGEFSKGSRGLRSERASASKHFEEKREQRRKKPVSSERETTKYGNETSVTTLLSCPSPSLAVKKQQLSNAIKGSGRDAPFNVQQSTKTNIVLKKKRNQKAAPHPYRYMMCTCKPTCDQPESYSDGDIDDICSSNDETLSPVLSFVSEKFKKIFQRGNSISSNDADKTSIYQKGNIVQGIKGGNEENSTKSKSFKCKNSSFGKVEVDQNSHVPRPKHHIFRKAENLISIDMKRSVYSPRQEKLYILKSCGDKCKCVRKPRQNLIYSKLIKPRRLTDSEDSLCRIIDLKEDQNVFSVTTETDLACLPSKSRGCHYILSEGEPTRGQFRRSKNQKTAGIKAKRSENSGMPFKRTTDAISKKNEIVALIPKVSNERENSLRSGVVSHSAYSNGTPLELPMTRPAKTPTEMKKRIGRLSSNPPANNHQPSKDKATHPIKKKCHNGITTDSSQEVKSPAKSLMTFIKKKERLKILNMKTSSDRRQNSNILLIKQSGGSDVSKLHNDKKIFQQDKGNSSKNVGQMQPFNRRRLLTSIKQKAGASQYQTLQSQNSSGKTRSNSKPLFGSCTPDKFECFSAKSQQSQSDPQSSKRFYSRAKVNAFYMHGPICSPYGNCYKLQADGSERHCSWSNSYLSIKPDSSSIKSDGKNCVHTTTNCKVDSPCDIGRRNAAPSKLHLDLVANTNVVMSQPEEGKTKITETSTHARSFTSLFEYIQHKKINEIQSRDDSFSTPARNSVSSNPLPSNDDFIERFTVYSRALNVRHGPKADPPYVFKYKQKGNTDDFIHDIHKLDSIETRLLPPQDDMPSGSKRDVGLCKEKAGENRIVETTECLGIATDSTPTVQEPRGTDQLMAKRKPSYTSMHLEGKVASISPKSWKNTNAVRKHIQLELRDKCQRNMSIIQDINLEKRKGKRETLECVSDRLVHHGKAKRYFKFNNELGGKDTRQKNSDKPKPVSVFPTQPTDQTIPKRIKRAQNLTFLNSKMTNTKKLGSLGVEKRDNDLHQPKSIHEKGKVQSNTSHQKSVGENSKDPNIINKSRCNFQCRENTLQSIVEKMKLKREQLGGNVKPENRYYFKTIAPEKGTDQQSAGGGAANCSLENKFKFIRNKSANVLAKVSGGGVLSKLQKLKTCLKTPLRIVELQTPKTNAHPDEDDTSKARLMTGSTMQTFNRHQSSFISLTLSIEHENVTRLSTYKVPDGKDPLEMNSEHVCDNRTCTKPECKSCSTKRALQIMHIKSSAHSHAEDGRRMKSIKQNFWTSVENEPNFFLPLEKRIPFYGRNCGRMDIICSDNVHHEYVLSGSFKLTNNTVVHMTMVHRKPEVCEDRPLVRNAKMVEFSSVDNCAVTSDIDKDSRSSDSVSVSQLRKHNENVPREFARKCFSPVCFHPQARAFQGKDRIMRVNLDLSSLGCPTPAIWMLKPREVGYHDTCHRDKSQRNIFTNMAAVNCETIHQDSLTPIKTYDEMYTTTEKLFIPSKTVGCFHEQRLKLDKCLKSLKLAQSLWKQNLSKETDNDGDQFLRDGRHRNKRANVSSSVDIGLGRKQYQTPLTVTTRNDSQEVNYAMLVDNENEKKRSCFGEKKVIPILSFPKLRYMRGIFVRPDREHVKKIISTRDIDEKTKYTRGVLTNFPHTDDNVREDKTISALQISSPSCKNEDPADPTVQTNHVNDQLILELDDIRIKHGYKQPLIESKVDTNDDKIDIPSREDLETLLQCQIDNMKVTQCNASLGDAFGLLNAGSGRERANQPQCPTPSCHNSLVQSSRKVRRTRRATSTECRGRKKASLKIRHCETERERQCKTRIELLCMSRDMEEVEQFCQARRSDDCLSYERITSTSLTGLTLTDGSDHRPENVSYQEEALNLETNNISPSNTLTNSVLYPYQDKSSYSDSCDNRIISTSKFDSSLNDELQSYEDQAAMSTATSPSDTGHTYRTCHSNENEENTSVIHLVLDNILPPSNRGTRTMSDNIKLDDDFHDEDVPDETHCENQVGESSVMCPSLPYYTEADIETISLNSSDNSSDIILSWANSSVSEEDIGVLDMGVIDNNENNATEIASQSHNLKFKYITPDLIEFDSCQERRLVSCSLAFNSKRQRTIEG